MEISVIIQNTLLASLMISLFISGYIFFSVMIFKNPYHTRFFNTWQFPMLFALVVDILFIKFNASSL